jgi:hypothetical protein
VGSDVGATSPGTSRRRYSSLTLLKLADTGSRNWITA